MILAISHLNAALIGAAALATIVAVLVATIGYRMSRRSGTAAEARTASLLEELRTRFDDLGRGVSQALDQSLDQAKTGRAEDIRSIDIETVLRRALAAARAIPGADAARVTVSRPDGRLLTRADGFTSDDGGDDPFWPPPPGRLRTLRVDFDAGGDPAAIKAGLAVPMRAEPEAPPEPDTETGPETIGLLSVFTRSERGGFAEAEAEELEQAGRLAAPDVDIALRFDDAQRRAVIDLQTGLHNKAYFLESLASEVRRAVRHTRPLALLTFDLDDFKAINDEYGHIEGDEVVTEIAKRVRACRARQEDVPCRAGGGDEFAVILPESDLGGAARFYARLSEAIVAQPMPHVDHVSLSAGIAELWSDPHETESAFLARAYAARQQAKQRGKGRLAASVTLDQAARQAGFTLRVPAHVSPEWTARVTHLPSPDVAAMPPVVLIQYVSTIDGGEVLRLTESPAQGEPGADAESALSVDRGGTRILLESKTAGGEWLAQVAETLVPVP